LKENAVIYLRIILTVIY